MSVQRDISLLNKFHIVDDNNKDKGVLSDADTPGKYAQHVS